MSAKTEIKRIQLTHKQSFDLRTYLMSLSNEELINLTEEQAIEKLGFRLSIRSIDAYRKEIGLSKKKPASSKDTKALEELVMELSDKIEKQQADIDILKSNYRLLVNRIPGGKVI